MESKPIALVIEDDADLNEIFSSALENAGYQVRSVFDGATAQQILADMTPAIVTLDLHMPGISGEAVLKYIRTDDMTLVVVGDKKKVEEQIQDYATPSPEKK